MLLLQNYRLPDATGLQLLLYNIANRLHYIIPNFTLKNKRLHSCNIL